MRPTDCRLTFDAKRKKKTYWIPRGKKKGREIIREDDMQQADYQIYFPLHVETKKVEPKKEEVKPAATESAPEPGKVVGFDPCKSTPAATEKGKEAPKAPSEKKIRKSKAKRCGFQPMGGRDQCSLAEGHEGGHNCKEVTKARTRKTAVVDADFDIEAQKEDSKSEPPKEGEQPASDTGETNPG